ncbi:unnamed protein product, partial [Rhizoctonia solani]
MGSNPMDKGSRSGRVLGLVGTLRICRMKAAGMEHLDLELEASEDLIGMYTTKADTRHLDSTIHTITVVLVDSLLVLQATTFPSPLPVNNLKTPSRTRTHNRPSSSSSNSHSSNSHSSRNSPQVSSSSNREDTRYRTIMRPTIRISTLANLRLVTASHSSSTSQSHTLNSPSSRSHSLNNPRPQARSMLLDNPRSSTVSNRPKDMIIPNRRVRCREDCRVYSEVGPWETRPGLERLGKLRVGLAPVTTVVVPRRVRMLALGTQDINNQPPSKPTITRTLDGTLNSRTSPMDSGS